ncbi:MAG: GIY-YIG nuclease family protein [Candidatus Cybelea sp.]
MKTSLVYMLLCADGSFYVGVTNNLEIRVGQHQFGFDSSCYTFSRRPVKLVHSSDFHNVDDAIAWEKQLKGWSRAKKSALVANDWSRIHDLAECVNETASRYCGESSFDSAQDDTGTQDDKGWLLRF